MWKQRPPKSAPTAAVESSTVAGVSNQSASTPSSHHTAAANIKPGLSPISPAAPPSIPDSHGGGIGGPKSNTGAGGGGPGSVGPPSVGPAPRSVGPPSLASPAPSSTGGGRNAGTTGGPASVTGAGSGVGTAGNSNSSSSRDAPTANSLTVNLVLSDTLLNLYRNDVLVCSFSSSNDSTTND